MKRSQRALHGRGGCVLSSRIHSQNIDADDAARFLPSVYRRAPLLGLLRAGMLVHGPVCF